MRVFRLIVCLIHIHYVVRQECKISFNLSSCPRCGDVGRDCFDVFYPESPAVRGGRSVKDRHFKTIWCLDYCSTHAGRGNYHARAPISSLNTRACYKRGSPTGNFLILNTKWRNEESKQEASRFSRHEQDCPLNKRFYTATRLEVANCAFSCCVCQQ